MHLTLLERFVRQCKYQQRKAKLTIMLRLVLRKSDLKKSLRKCRVLNKNLKKINKLFSLRLWNLKKLFLINLAMKISWAHKYTIKVLKQSTNRFMKKELWWSNRLSRCKINWMKNQNRKMAWIPSSRNFTLPWRTKLQTRLS